MKFKATRSELDRPETSRPIKNPTICHRGQFDERGSRRGSRVEQIVRGMEKDKIQWADPQKLTLQRMTLIADQPQVVHEEIADALYLLREEFRKDQEEKQLAVRYKEGRRWNSATFRPADEYSGTDISAHLEAPIAEGRNQVYFASFQLAWAELVQSLASRPSLKAIRRWPGSSTLPKSSARRYRRIATSQNPGCSEMSSSRN